MAPRGRKPLPRAMRASTPVSALPRCPPHLSEIARKEWRRLAAPLHEIGVLTLVDRAALAAYCQAWAHWVEAEQRLRETPALLKTPNGHVQQSPWLTVANKQLELMGRYMAELGLTPVARTRLDLPAGGPQDPVDRIELVIVGTDEHGNRVESPLEAPPHRPRDREDPDAPLRIPLNENI